MARTILEVDAWIVDANGSYARLTNYPKKFDSNSYQGDLEGTMNRAKGEYHKTLGAMYENQAGRQIQTVRLSAVDGTTILKQSLGGFPADPEPETPAAESEGE